MGRPTSLMNREVYYDSIAKDNEYEHTSLNNSGSQKNTMDLNTIEEKRLSKVVLIVDDDPDMKSVFSLGLQDKGFEVYTFNDPLEVLSRFRPKFNDLMLIDISMRRMNGIDLAR